MIRLRHTLSVCYLTDNLLYSSLFGNSHTLNQISENNQVIIKKKVHNLAQQNLKHYNI